MQRIEIDWSDVTSMSQMWHDIVIKSGHPAWHGRNLDALADGWVTGGLDEHGPPYEFVFISCDQVPEELKEVAAAVMEIAEESVQENGGSIRRGQQDAPADADNRAAWPSRSAAPKP
ncbi:MAG: barstar family protein [bacterium]|nr:barstar family protein [bacterium]